MEQLPAYFKAMSSKYQEAARLERMAAATLQHARSVPSAKETVPVDSELGQRGDPAAEQTQSLPTPGVSHATDTAPSPTSNLGQPNISMDQSVDELPGPGPWLWGEMDMSAPWPSNLEDPFADAMFDWFAWDLQG